MTTEHERQKDADRKRTSRLKARRVHVSVSSASLRRRKRLEKNVKKWLRYYFPDVFEYDFTENQGAIVDAILTAAQSSGDQAIAAPRGEGKTSIVECMVIYCVMTGILSFPVIFAATGDDAERILANIKSRIEENPQLATDYGEVCGPAAALEGQNNRASGQVVHGHIGATEFSEQRTKIKWSGREAVLPTIKCKHSRATGAVIATRGLDAAVRGIRYGTKRPDLGLIDDPETRDIATSDDDRQRNKLEMKIDQDIAGCAGQKRRLSRLILTTLMSKKSISAKYTDPEQKPSFRGKRFRYMVVPPERQDMWDEFVMLQDADWKNDPRTYKAHEYYLANREAMDAGAVVGNPHRRGDEIEASAIETYYVEVARLGPEAVATEFDNDPPEESGPIESGITAHRVQSQVNGFPRCLIPSDCVVVTQGIDCQKLGLYWVVRAWRSDGTGFVIDYNFTPTFGTTYGSDEGVDVAIHRAILHHMDAIVRDRYCTADGTVKPIDLTLIDSKYNRDAVFQACQEIRIGVMPAMGYGKSGGTFRPSFSQGRQVRDGYFPGDGWNLVEVNQQEWRGLWRVDMDTNKWKGWEHDRWMTAVGNPGYMSLFGSPGDRPDRLSQDQMSHMTYAKHLTAEIEVEEFEKGSLVRKWVNKHQRPNHYFDASYMSCVAASVKGIRLLRASEEPKTKPKRPAQTETQSTEESFFATR